MENNDEEKAAVSQEFLEAEKISKYKERVRAESDLDMGSAEIFIDGREEDSSVETRLQSIVEDVKALLAKIGEQNDIIQGQDEAIVMLKEYIVQNGLKPFWENPNAEFMKDLQEGRVAVDALIARNKEIAPKYRRATSKDTTPFPTPEELLKKYEEKTSPAVEALVDLMSGSRKELALPFGEDDRVQKFDYVGNEDVGGIGNIGNEES